MKGIEDKLAKAKYFESAAKKKPTPDEAIINRRFVSLMENLVKGQLRKRKMGWAECPVPPFVLWGLAELMANKAISGKVAETIVKDLFESNA